MTDTCTQVIEWSGDVPCEAGDLYVSNVQVKLKWGMGEADYEAVEIDLTGALIDFGCDNLPFDAFPSRDLHEHLVRAYLLNCDADYWEDWLP